MSPSGVDTLKQMIYDYAGSADPRVAPFFYSLGDSVRSTLESSVPGYGEMTANYARTSDTLKNVMQELGAGMEYGKAKNPGGMVRRLSYALNQHNDYRQLMVEALDEAAQGNLKQDLAGYASRKWQPRGLQGVVATTPLALGALLHNPATAAGAIPAMALSSPRVSANIIALLAAMNRWVPAGVGTGAVSGAAVHLMPPPPPTQ